MRRPWQLAVVLAFTVAACTGAATPSPSPIPATASPSPSPTGTPSISGVTLTFWSSEGWPDAFHKSWAAFEQATGAKIDYIAVPNPFEDNLLAKWTGGDRPDLLGWHAVPGQFLKIQPDKNLVDLTDEAFVKNTKFHLYDYVGSVNGHVYSALTMYPTLIGVYYNKDIFSRLGLQIPTTWEEMVGLCSKISAGDSSIVPIASGAGAQWPLSVIELAYLADEVKAGIEKEINDGTIKATDPRLVASWQAILDMKDKGCFDKDLSTAQYEDQVSRLAEGKAAMVIQGTWMLPDLIAGSTADKINTQLGFFPISAKGQTVSWTTSQVGTYQVPTNKDAAKQAAALEFIRFVTGPGYQQYLTDSGDLPVFEGYTTPTSVSPILLQANGFFEQAGVTSFGTLLKHGGYGDVGVDLNEMLLGTKTPQQVGESVQTQWETAEQAISP
jgi:raffinose/stachyose/melibiose transport system substrate-binding protein